MADVDRLWGVPVADIPEPLQSAIVLRAPEWIAAYQRDGWFNFSALDEALLAKFHEWRVATYWRRR